MKTARFLYVKAILFVVGVFGLGCVFGVLNAYLWWGR